MPQVLTKMRAILMIGTGVLGLLAAPVAAKGPEPLPPYVAAYEPQTPDERGLWMEVDEVERKLRDSPIVIRDEALNAYVRNVLCKTVGTDRCNSVRIYVVEISAFNASMAPNGMMLVHSGLLLRARSEAELAAVLGHEFAHFELRHTLKRMKQSRTAWNVIAWAGAIGGIVGSDTSDLQWSLYGSTFSFGRDQEEEADLLGMKYLAASPYPAAAASEVWQNLMAENDATAVGRKQKPGRRYFAAFFDTHPTELKRAVYLKKEADALNDVGDAGGTGHRLGIAKQLPNFLASQLKVNDFGGTEYILSELSKVSGWTGDLLYARGELYRLRGNPRDLVSAAEFYSKSISAGFSEPEVHRNLGVALLRSGKVSEGKLALEEYLRRKPEASDAKAISALMSN